MLNVSQSEAEKPGVKVYTIGILWIPKKAYTHQSGPEEHHLLNG